MSAIPAPSIPATNSMSAFASRSLARKIAYGEKIVASGPLYRTARSEGGAIRVRFDRDGQRTRHRPGAMAPEGRAPLPTDRLARLHHRGRRSTLGGSRGEDRGRLRPRLQPASAEARRGAVRLGEFAALQSLQPGRPARLALPHRRLEVASRKHSGRDRASGAWQGEHLSRSRLLPEPSWLAFVSAPLSET